VEKFRHIIPHPLLKFPEIQTGMKPVVFGIIFVDLFERIAIQKETDPQNGTIARHKISCFLKCLYLFNTLF